MMKKLLFLALFFTTQFGFAQDNRINVLAEAEVELPADVVQFSIDLSYRDPSNMKVAFSEHKKAEEKLVKFLKSLKINSNDIKYSLIDFQKRQDYSQQGVKPSEYFETSQTVQFKYSAFSEYPDILIKLVNAGYTNVRTQFTSSKIDDFNAEVLSKSIENAKQKAEVLARASDRRLGKVVQISDPITVNPVYRNEMMMAKSNGGFINEFSQSIKKTFNVSVTFELL